MGQSLHQLSCKEADWTRRETEQHSFELLTRWLVSAPVLRDPDPTKTYKLDTGASGFGVEAVVSQKQDEKERVIAYYSKTHSPPERNYCITRQELLAKVKAIKRICPYLYRQKFRLCTDHASLRWLCRRKEPSIQFGYW